MRKMFLMFVVMFVAVAANAGSKEPATVKQFGVPALSQIDFNRLAFASGINLFWNSDKNNSQNALFGFRMNLGTEAADFFSKPGFSFNSFD